MSEKFPYGYDLNAYIDKAFEQMKADFPWATRDMIAEHTNFGIEKVGDDYQYVRYFDLDTPGSFYVGRADLERDPRIKEFLGF
jgi:hypothetical protein